MRQLLGQSTLQAALAGSVLVLPSPPHLAGAAGAVPESFHPGFTSVHVPAAPHYRHPSAQAVHVTAGAVAEL